MRVRESDYFAHHGVKGMRWGIRHDKPSSGKKRASGVKETSKVSRKEARLNSRSESRKQYDETRSKKTYQMSDEELRAVLNRMNMEKQYKNLNRELYHPGQQFAVKSLQQIGKIGIGAFGAYAVGIAGKKAAKGIATVGATAMLRRAARRM